MKILSLKKLNRTLAFFFLSSLFFSSTNDINDAIVDNETLSVIERYAICKDLAVYHSDGLKFAYTKLKEMKSSNELTLRASNENNQYTLINSLLSKYMSQGDICSNLSTFEDQINFYNHNGISLRSNTSNPSTPVNLDTAKIFSYYNNILKKVTAYSQEEYEMLFQDAMLSNEFSSFSEIEQNQLLIMFAIFLDSSKYWKENLDEWKKILNDENSVQLRARDFLYFAVLAFSDSRGATIWGTAGVIGGGIAGSLGGGVGAIPGAVGGGVGGIITGAIGSSLDVVFRYEIANPNYIDYPLYINNDFPIPFIY